MLKCVLFSCLAFYTFFGYRTESLLENLWVTVKFQPCDKCAIQEPKTSYNGSNGTTSWCHSVFDCCNDCRDLPGCVLYVYDDAKKHCFMYHKGNEGVPSLHQSCTSGKIDASLDMAVYTQLSVQPNPFKVGSQSALWVTAATRFKQKQEFRNLIANSSFESIEDDVILDVVADLPTLYIQATTPDNKIIYRKLDVDSNILFCRNCRKLKICKKQDGLCQRLFQQLNQSMNSTMPYVLVSESIRLSTESFFSALFDEITLSGIYSIAYNFPGVAPQGIRAALLLRYHDKPIACTWAQMELSNSSKVESIAEESKTDPCHMSSSFIGDDSFPAVCLNGGLPNKNGTECICNATTGYFGPMCEFSCDHGSVNCTSNWDTGFCTCERGFTWNHCSANKSSIYSNIDVVPHLNNTGVLLKRVVQTGYCNSILDILYAAVGLFQLQTGEYMGESEIIGFPCSTNVTNIFPSLAVMQNNIDTLCLYTPYDDIKTCKQVQLKPFTMYNLTLRSPDWNWQQGLHKSNCDRNLTKFDHRVFRSQEETPQAPLPPSLEGKDRNLTIKWNVKSCSGIITNLVINITKHGGGDIPAQCRPTCSFNVSIDCRHQQNFSQPMGTGFESGEYTAKMQIATKIGASPFSDSSSPFSLDVELIPTAVIVGIAVGCLVTLSIIIVSVFTYYRKKIRQRDWKDIKETVDTIQGKSRPKRRRKPKTPDIELSEIAPRLTQNDTQTNPNDSTSDTTEQISVSTYPPPPQWTPPIPPIVARTSAGDTGPYDSPQSPPFEDSPQRELGTTSSGSTKISGSVSTTPSPLSPHDDEDYVEDVHC